MDCIFCKILNGELESQKLYEDDKCIVIQDKFPVAPVHLLVIPKKHIATIADMEEEDAPLMGHLAWVAKQVAEQYELPGYKLLWNVGAAAGQSVFHVHLHILGDPEGKPLTLEG